MNAPAAIRATYSDLRLVKSRKVAVIYLEIPIEQAEEFVGSFGMPNPAEEKWVGIARLNPTADRVEAPKERQRFSSLRPSAQAALLCEKPTFWKFLWETYRVQVEDTDSAATVVRSACKVNTRASFDSNPKAADDWFSLKDKYDAWLAAA